jgi:DNA polymerase III delta subunit
MHSNWPIWDFFSSYPKGSWRQLKNPISLVSFDALSLRWMKEHLLSGLSTEEKPKLLLGGEIKLDWLKEQWESLSFFWNSESYIILMAEELSSDVKNYLLEKNFDGSECQMALTFQIENAFSKKWMAKKNASIVQIIAPRFWEHQKLIDFLSSYFKLPLNLEAKNYLLQAIEPDMTHLAQVLRQIKLVYPQSSLVQLEDIFPLIEQTRIDQFQLATFLNKKQFNEFFEKLNQLTFDYSKWRLLFWFLTTHFIKVFDPSYLEKKNRLNNYEKEILLTKKIWKENELECLIKFLEQVSTSLKLKSPTIQAQLKHVYLTQLMTKEGPESWKLT